MTNFLKYILEHVLLLPSFTKKWDDIIFRGRNQSYGAYELRRIVAKNQFVAMFLTILSFSVFLFWMKYEFHDEVPTNFEFEKMVEFKGFDANLMSVKPLQKEQAPPPPAEKLKEDLVVEEVKKDRPIEVTKDKPEPVVEAKKPLNTDSLRKVSEKAGTDTGKKYEAGLDSGVVKPAYEEGPAGPYGGLSEFMKWVQQNLKVPKEAMENNVHGTVYVHFTIDGNGDLTKVTLSKGLGYGCDEAVMEVLRRAPPWKPAIRDGKPVSQRFIIPVKI